MELYLIVLSVFFLLSLKLLFGRENKKYNLPPTPTRPFPVIGHLHILKNPLHRTFLSLSQSLGDSPIFSLRLGNKLTFVISSYSIVEECFTKNDIVLANRPKFLISKHVEYNYTSMVSAPYGDYWRYLRRVGAIEIFSSHRLNSYLCIRQDEIRHLILRLSQKSKQEFVKVEMRTLFVDFILNNVMRMVAGKRFYGDGTEHDDDARCVRQLIAEVVDSAGAGNPADYFPVLSWITDYEKRVKNVADRFDKFLQGLVDEKRAQKEKGGTLIDRLLSLQETQPDYYTDVVIKGIIVVMILAGTDTLTGTLEWAISNLLNHTETLKKVKTEIDNQIGSDRLIEESDIKGLPFLQNIVSETLRLYPVAPTLLPHMASEDCMVGGYDVPRDTMLLINVWAMQRDPSVWEDPLEFKPERFEKKGLEQKLIPFGIGRRACPGSGLAQRLVNLTLGSLIQCFEWERVGDEKVDMREGKLMHLATPMEAMCKARPIVHNMFDSSF